MKQNPEECIKGTSSDVCVKRAVSSQEPDPYTKEMCISSANLSSFADGEYLPDEEEKRHLQNCTCCQKTLEDFKKLSNVLHDTLQEECPPEFINIMSERIQQRIRHEEKYNKKKKKLFFSSKRTFIHAAAAIMLFSFVLYLLTDNGGEGFPENPEEIQRESTEIPAKENIAASGGVDIRNILPVSHSSAPVHFLVSVKDQKDKFPALIGKEVTQVWVYDKGEKRITSSYIHKILASAAGKESIKNTTAAGSSAGKFSFTVTTTGKKAVLLVRTLAAVKFQLLSPVQPQPEQKYFYGTGDEKTVLKLDFLPSE